MKRNDSLLIGGSLALAVMAALGLATSVSQAVPKATARAPVFELVADWPKMPLPSAGEYGTPLVISTSTGKPKPWNTGEVAGTCVDSRDHVFILTRGNLVNSPETLISVPSPPIIEFDPQGNVVNAWGDRSVMPNGVHGCFVDYQDNVWIAGNGDGIVQKYPRNGSALPLLQIGTRGVCDNPPANTCGASAGNPLANQSHTLLNQPADIWVDPNPDPVTGRRGTIYIADGYGNNRVAVFNPDGTYLRQFGGVAGVVNDPLTDSPGLFSPTGGGHPHCVLGGNDGLIYACDRANDRIHVFTKTGGFVRTIAVVPGTGNTRGVGGAPGLGTAGSAWDLDFSGDRQQAWLYEVDGGNELMHVMNRQLGSIAYSFGSSGLHGGQFTFLHSVARDSRGDIYTGETINGRRIQKFKRIDCNAGAGGGDGGGNCR